MNWETRAHLINDVAHPTCALQQDLLSWLWNYTFNCCLFHIFPWLFHGRFKHHVLRTELAIFSVKTASPCLVFCSVLRGMSLHPVAQIRMSGPSLNVSFSEPCIQSIFECELTEDEMAGWHHQLNGRESEWTPGVGWWTGKSGVLLFMGTQRIRHDWVNWTELNCQLQLSGIPSSVHCPLTSPSYTSASLPFLTLTMIVSL